VSKTPFGALSTVLMAFEWRLTILMARKAESALPSLTILMARKAESALPNSAF